MCTESECSDDFDAFFCNDEEELWVQALADAGSATDGLRILFNTDKETFYLYGDTIFRMLQLRFEHNLDTSS